MTQSPELLWRADLAHVIPSLTPNSMLELTPAQFVDVLDFAHNYYEQQKKAARASRRRR